MSPAAAIMKWSLALVAAIATLSAQVSDAIAAERSLALIVSDGSAKPVQHGLVKLTSALRDAGRGIEESASVQTAKASEVVVIGLASENGEAAKLARQLKVTVPKQPESLVIRRFDHVGKTGVLVIGADAVGLMYGLLDVAKRIAWAGASQDLLSCVNDVDEAPYAPERALSIYTFNRAYWESRFYDEAYWEQYLDLLAENRFDSLVVIFGYENGGFLAPCYPYFFDVEGFPQVRMIGITPEQQRRNLAALNRLIRMAHDRGIRFTAGIWDHIYRGGVQGGGIPGADDATRRPTPGLAWGVTGENLVPYTKAALAAFVKAVPDLDAIQFRMHDESGLKNSEQETFWRDVFLMMKQAAPRLRLDLRAKGLPDSVIQSARESGVPFRITTKYWMEQMGLPFHPTHINKENQFDRRHSYADMLRYPQTYKMHWRLWNGGTSRVLLWGDPDYARRFAESSRLYDGDGFEVNEPLCTKMEAQSHDSRPFDLLAPQHRYYQYEFERYWHFFQVFGRVGYSTNTSPEIWHREFARRFGQEAGPYVEAALHQASRVLPRIVASCYPYGAFPMTRGWAEKQRLGDLRQYAKAEGSDIQQFASFDEEARMLLEGGETAKVRPAANARWFDNTAEKILGAARDAETRAAGHRNKEFDSTLTDLKILAHLARFHARRIPAAVSYRIYERTKAPEAFRDALQDEQQALAAWQDLVTAAADYYADDLKMGVRSADLCGHWRDELAALKRGISELERQKSDLQPLPVDRKIPHYDVHATRGDGTAPSVLHQRVTSAPEGRPITISAQIKDPAGIQWVRLRYRSVNQQQDYRTLSMLRGAESDAYHATIPAEEIPPAWDLMYFIEAMDQHGNGRIYPDLNVETPYIIIKLQR